MPDFRDAFGRKEFLAEQAPGFVWRLATFGGHVAEGEQPGGGVIRPSSKW